MSLAASPPRGVLATYQLLRTLQTHRLPPRLQVSVAPRLLRARSLSQDSQLSRMMLMLCCQTLWLVEWNMRVGGKGSFLEVEVVIREQVDASVHQQQ